MLPYIASALIILCTAALWRFLMFFWWQPRRLAAHLRRQGIRGPPKGFVGGNENEIMKMRRAVKERDMEGVSHDIVEQVFPDHCKWSKQYGKRYVSWWGKEPRIVINEPEIVREVLSTKSSQFEKSEVMVAPVIAVIGRGLVSVNGEEWHRHRRLVSPAFHYEQLQGMTATFANCTSSMLDRWEVLMQQNSEVEVCKDIQALTGNIISHTAFGSSYMKGQRIFEILSKEIVAEFLKIFSISWFPGYRFLPIPANFRIRKLHHELDSLITVMIADRRESVKQGRSTSYGHDLLGLMLKESEGDKSFTNRDVIQECRTFYFAGHETTAILLSWTMMLLAAYPEWQDRARSEVEEVCGDAIPDGDMLSKLKLIGMIIYESLRLYPPAAQIARACLQEDTWLQDLHVPKGAAVTLLILAMHHDKELWGEDVNEFRPERFKNGITNACKHPNAFMPFSFGPRVCVGQSFAMMEAKAALAMILRRFSFRLSPNYRHNPTFSFGLRPTHGVPLMLTKISSKR